MVLYRDYNKEKKLDRAWYKSSNIVYSECDDNLNELKTLRVVFKNGATYQYKKVDVNDYLMFMHGGLDGSNGKALNKFIKPKYEFEKLEDTNLTKLNESLENLIKERKEKLLKEQEEKDNQENKNPEEN